MKKRILSGMRPTGKLHLGHLVGALDNWVKLQEEYDCFFMVADWHALMGEYEEPAILSESIIDNVIDWLSIGIDPKK
ncbi:MAG: tryptophan--tRNA ligase, partial [Candidatus Omnitrophota bacterium]